MKYQAIEYIMDQLDIEVYSVSDVGNNNELNTIYDRRDAANKLSGFEPPSALRCLPKEALEGAKTVVSIAVPYEVKNPFTSGTPRGFITNMAWEYDYHEVVRHKLSQVKEAMLQSHPDAKFLEAVDTGPINDRMTAFGAGLGWIGRNQFIIDERIGSGFYIGVIITDFKIDGAKPWRESFESKCGDCRKCQIACPANALTGEYEFNGQRCISSLTQFKRELSYDERYRIGRNLYGCDICQWACPHNNKVSDISDKLACKTRNIVDPFAILGHSNKSFKREYGHMGFAWRGLKVYKRNALIVIGNDRQKKDYEPLKSMMKTLPEGLQSYWLYAMMMICPDKTNQFLEKALNEKDSHSANVDALLGESEKIAKWMQGKFRN